MHKLIDWIKRNKLTTALMLVIGYFVLRTNAIGIPFTRNYSIPQFEGTSSDYIGAPGSLNMMRTSAKSMPVSGGGYGEPAPVTDVTSRMVVSTSYLSLQVKKVNDAMKTIKQTIERMGGYMVNSNISNPNEVASGTITVRVPSTKLESVLDTFRGLAVKVVSENLEGTDVTDQYVDIDEHIRILEGNKARLTELMNKAVEVSDILRIQQEIFNLQSQIDSYKGQQQYLSKTAEMAKITVYLSTDEFELPYAPSQPWRPEVIFKEAVRSLVGNLRNLGSLIIWAGVYSVIVIPIIAIMWYIKHKKTI